MPEHSLHRMYGRWLPLALGLTAAVNLIISAFLPMPSQALRLHEDGSLTHLVHTEQSTVDRRFGFYMELGDVAAGGVLVVPLDSPVEADLATGLSGVAIIEDDYDPDELPPESVPEGDPLGPLSTSEGDISYWIVPGNPTETRWWQGRTPEGIVIIPESIAPIPAEAP